MAREIIDNFDKWKRHQEKTPAEVFHNICEFEYGLSLCRGVYPRNCLPGESYMSLPQETKDILRNLRSEDLKAPSRLFMTLGQAPEMPGFRRYQLEKLEKKLKDEEESRQKNKKD